MISDDRGQEKRATPVEETKHAVSALSPRPFWSHPVVGYLCSPLLVALSVGLLKLEHLLLSSFHFPGASFFFIILLVAIIWGLGPALFTVFLSMLALDYFYLPPPFVFPLDMIAWAAIRPLLPFVVVGSLTAIVMVQREAKRRQALVAKREQYKRASELEATFEAIADCVFTFDEHGFIHRTNKAARQLFSFSDISSLTEQAEIMATRDERGNLLPLEQLPISRVLHGEVLTGTGATEVQMKGVQGQKLNFSVTGAPTYYADGSLSGAILVLRDVTQRRQLEKRTQQALSALLAMATTLFETDAANKEASLSSVTTTQETITRLVEIAHKTLGCLHTSITLADDSGVLQPSVFIGFTAEQEPIAQRIAQSLKALKAMAPLLKRLQMEEVFVLETTTPPFKLWEEVGVFHPLLVPIALNEQAIGILSLDYSDTEHDYNTDEIALAQASARLIALVVERDRLVSERTEARANEMSLRETKQRMEEFLGMASHELRTPLTAVSGNIQIADMLLSRFLAQPTQAPEKITALFEALLLLFQRADRQAELLNRLVNDLVDVSRIQSEKLQLQSVTCDVGTIVSDSVEEQRQVAAPRSIGLSLPPEAVSVMADADRIGQVVMNYLTNALKYSRPECAVEVRLLVEGKVARVEVSDQGPGLSRQEMERMWERFYQVPGIKVQSGSSVGLGIGLHICRTIIKQHHGEVGVQSTPGQGSTFWFTLPLGEAATAL